MPLVNVVENNEGWNRRLQDEVWQGFVIHFTVHYSFFYSIYRVNAYNSDESWTCEWKIDGIEDLDRFMNAAHLSFYEWLQKPYKEQPKPREKIDGILQGFELE